MTTEPFKATIVADNARVTDERDSSQPAVDPNAPKDDLDELRAWVMNHVSQWRNHRRMNYELLWDEYERRWRGLWSPEDKSRKSEKATMVTPALAEAVENIVAEVEEALFGRGDIFDMRADLADSAELKEVTDRNKSYLKEDLGRSDFTGHVGEALINGAVYGTGVAEIVVKTVKIREIVSSLSAIQPQAAMLPGMQQPGMQPQALMQPGMQGAMQPGAQNPAQTGMQPQDVLQPPVVPLQLQTRKKEVKLAYLQSVNPRNFLIDPTARNVDEALGVAVEEYVGAHIVRAGQKSGDFRDVKIGTSAGDTEIGVDRQTENEYVHDKVKIVRYYGLVPSHLLFPPGQTADLSNENADLADAQQETADVGLEDRVTDAIDGSYVLEDGSDGSTAVSGEKSVDPIDSDMVEAIVVIANDGVCIKAVQNPYEMEDRPIVAFPWDIVPGRFYGRGVCEKGLVPQKVLDAELRARLDALAYVSAPMMGMDASRLPRGFSLKVAPGKSILTNGKPSDVLFPMHFGQLEQSTFNHSQQLDQMVQRATGSLDVISLASKAGGDARPGAVSMMLSGIVKRHKRTLMQFLDKFYVPALRKLMWRNMQFYPERYTPMNWTFTASNSMGILQREYESQQLVALMQTMDPQSKEYKIMLMGVIGNTGLSHRTQVMKMIEQSISNAQQIEQFQTQQQVDPVQQQIAAAGAQYQLAEIQAKIRELNSRANLQDVKAQNQQLEPQFRQVEIATKGIYSVAADQQDREFDKRMRLVDQAVKMEDIRSNERIAHVQTGGSVTSEALRTAGSVASERVASAALRHQAKAKVVEQAVRGAADIASAHTQAKHAAAASVHGANTKAAGDLVKTFVGSQGQVLE